ncbi:TATA box-binding protein-associated factor RNA polymerase I subunit B, partial [Eschrichtius robustus]|nr:TATA box-binding protein-associated factor RNA polymerase I subunit B [Eschrichtius robustus]
MWRSREVINTGAIPNTKIQAINRGLKRKRKLEKGWDWYVCEGFQHILYQQAKALQTLGVGPELKNEVLHNFWKRYLQKSKQAYCKNPVYTSRRKTTVLEDNPSHSDWDSEPELLKTASVCSGSLDGVEYSLRKEKGIVKMTVPRTLAFCYLSLLWQRETITLADLL